MGHQVEERKIRTETVGKWQIRITSYKLGEEFICTVDNVDPGATIARATAPSREAAESRAVEEARQSMPA